MDCRSLARRFAAWASLRACSASRTSGWASACSVAIAFTHSVTGRQGDGGAPHVWAMCCSIFATVSAAVSLFRVAVRLLLGSFDDLGEGAQQD